jgi:hypothetical protein
MSKKIALFLFSLGLIVPMVQAGPISSCLMACYDEWELCASAPFAKRDVCGEEREQCRWACQ